MDHQDPLGADPLVDLVRETVIVFDLEGLVSVWNVAAERLYGFSKDEALGRQLGQLVPYDLPDPLRLITAELLRSETSWTGEFTRLDRDGHPMTVRATWTLRRDRTHQPLDIVETAFDITAEHRIAAELRDGEHRQYNAFQSADVAILEADFSGIQSLVETLGSLAPAALTEYLTQSPRILRQMIGAIRIADANDRALTLFAVSHKGKLLETISPYWPEESAPHFAGIIVAALAGSTHYLVDAKLRTANGQSIDTSITACFPPTGLAGGKTLLGIVDLQSTYENRDALKISEQRYRNLFQFLPIALLRVNRRELTTEFNALRSQGVRDLRVYIDEHPQFLDLAMNAIKIVEVNQQAVALFGAESADQLLGPVTRMWTETPEVFRRSIESRYRSSTKYEEEMRLRNFQGGIVHVNYITTFPPALQVLSAGIIGLIDITDRVMAQDSLAKVQAEFAHAARVSMLGELTASIAHEVNQPLATIVTSGQASLRWLNRPQPDLDEVGVLIGESVTAARRASDIVARIRTMAVRRSPEQKPTDLNELVEEAILFLRRELDRHRVGILLKLTPGLPPCIADRVQVQQVIVNLAVNASQAMAQADKSPRRLTVRTSLRHADMLCLEIADTGPGIPAEQQDQLFKSFFTTKSNGMGIGLSICKTIVEAHHGEITVRSGQGDEATIFAFTLPVFPGAVKPPQPG